VPHGLAGFHRIDGDRAEKIDARGYQDPVQIVAFQHVPVIVFSVGIAIGRIALGLLDHLDGHCQPVRSVVADGRYNDVLLVTQHVVDVPAPTPADADDADPNGLHGTLLAPGATPGRGSRRRGQHTRRSFLQESPTIQRICHLSPPMSFQNVV